MFGLTKEDKKNLRSDIMELKKKNDLAKKMIQDARDEFASNNDDPLLTDASNGMPISANDREFDYVDKVIEGMLDGIDKSTNEADFQTWKRDNAKTLKDLLYRIRGLYPMIDTVID